MTQVNTIFKELAIAVLIAVLTGGASSALTMSAIKTEIDWIKLTLLRHEDKIEQLDWLRSTEARQLLKRRITDGTH